MKCPTCDFKNPEDFTFCGKCGAQLPTSATCPSCGTDIPDSFAFCGKCGTRITPVGAPAALVTDADLARLQPYLLPRQLENLPPAPLWQRDHLAQVQARLDRLLDTVITYLPCHLVQTELAGIDVPPVGGAFLDGALLFADISGFTALSERLSTLGKTGAEQVTTLVNHYFSAMLEIIYAHGGDLFKFGGDALLAFFPDGEGNGSANALQTAWAMQQAMTTFHQVETSLGSFPLQMKIGLHAGSVFAARVGNAEAREFIVTGPVVNVTAQVEGLAQAGQILITPTIRNRGSFENDATKPGFLHTVKGPSGYYLVERVIPGPALASPRVPPTAADLKKADDTPGNTLRQSVAALEQLTPYLPSGLLPRLVSSSTRHESSGEHRIVAVLFVNFVGASELITHLGPGREAEIAQALNQYFVTMQESIARYGGVVNKIDLYDHGDKLLALFGAPMAHEDDAERAVRAALEMQAALPQSPPRAGQFVLAQHSKAPGSAPPLAARAPWHRPPGQVRADGRGRETGETERGVPWLESQRIGISTGLVFAGHVGASIRREYTVMGDEVNLSARLMSAAQEGEILLSSYVRRKVNPFFELADRGAINLKGKSKPVPAFTIVGRRAQPEPVRGIRGLRSPIVGRATEEATLQRLADNLRMGRGNILSLIGEAGLGKSRMTAELRARIEASGEIIWLEGRCLSYTQQVSYSAFTGIIHSALGIVETDNEFDVRAKLEHRVEQLLPDAAGKDVLPYLAHFLNLPLSHAEAERVSYLEGEALQRQILRALTVLLEQIAWERPLALTFDDLHWADSASLTLLERCLTLADRAPALILLIYRPERTHGCWALGQTAARDYPHRYTEIVLSPLDRKAGQDEQLVRNLLSVDELPPALAQLIGRAEGNPFYVEEIIRTLIDQGAIAQDLPRSGRWRLVQKTDPITIPDTLQDLIMTRLDRLMEEARHTLQLASVVGRAFRHQVLAWLASAAALAAQLDINLTSLQRAELIREHNRLPDLEYTFKHIMIRDVAYESLLVRDRQTYHQLVAQYLEETYLGQKREEIYELLAHHYSLSQDQNKALDYLIKAGDKARAAYANPEAITFYRQAELLAEELLLFGKQAIIAEKLADVLSHIGEYDEALARYTDALGHYTQTSLQADLHRRIADTYEKRGEYPAALAACACGIELLSQKAQHPAESTLSPELVRARLLITRSRIKEKQGQSEAVLADGQASLAILEGSTHYREIAQAHNVLGLSYRASQPAKAIEHLEKGLAFLERIGDEHEAARIYNNLAILYYQTDLSRSATYFGRTLDIMRRLGNPRAESVAYMNLGIVQYARGDYGQATNHYQHSLEIKERLGDKMGISECHVNLGETFRAQGDPTQAILHLEKSLSITQEIGAHETQAECQRQLAECYLENDDPERALAACHQVLQYAQETRDREREGVIHRVMGQAYHQQTALDLALDHLAQSVRILLELNLEFDLAAARYNYALALAQADQTEGAREQLVAALELFRGLDLPQEQARIQTALEQLT